MGRCRAVNKCGYCARIAAVETSEMLMLDAMEDAPSIYLVLTARELLTRRDCRQHLAQIRRACKRRWPHIRWAVLVEFQRRGALHLNLLVKGVPTEQLAELSATVEAVWCARVDAEPAGQFGGLVNDGPGLVRYISLHFLKPSQAPPEGWRGHRSSQTRDYLVRPAAVMRAEAQRSLRFKRELFKLAKECREQTGEDLAADELEEFAGRVLELNDAKRWQLVQLHQELEPVLRRPQGRAVAR